jgi:hypothetical protein
MPQIAKKSFKMSSKNCKSNIYCYVHQKCNGCNNLLNSNSDKNNYSIILHTIGLYSIYPMYDSNVHCSSIESCNTLHCYVNTVKEYVSILC